MPKRTKLLYKDKPKLQTANTTFCKIKVPGILLLANIGAVASKQHYKLPTVDHIRSPQLSLFF